MAHFKLNLDKIPDVTDAERAEIMLQLGLNWDIPPEAKVIAGQKFMEFKEDDFRPDADGMLIANVRRYRFKLDIANGTLGWALFAVDGWSEFQPLLKIGQGRLYLRKELRRFGHSGTWCLDMVVLHCWW